MATAENRPELAPKETFTTLVPLFHYTQTELVLSRSFYDALDKFALDYKRSYAYWENKAVEKMEVKERIDERLTQSSVQVISSMSFVTCDMAYLRFLQDFEPQGLSEEEIFDFFKPCLAINTQASQVYELSVAETERVSVRDKSPDFIKNRIAPYLQKAVNHIPSWFKGSPAEYIFLVSKYSSFGPLIQPEVYGTSDEVKLRWEKQRTRDILDGKRPADSWAATIPRGIPDWVDEDKPPDKKAIEEELVNDLKDYELSIQERASLIRSNNYLASSFRDKYQKNKDRLQKKLDQIKIENPKLGDFLSFLHLRTVGEYDSQIRNYIHSPDRVLDPEAQSFWIEDNMKKIGIIQDGVLTDEGKESLSLMFFTLRGLSPQEERQRLVGLRAQNKKAHDAVRFNLQPMVNTLSDEDILLLSDFLDERKVEAGTFISFFADISVSRLKDYKEGENSSLDKSLKEFREFSGKFLRNNWQVLFQIFKGVLFRERVGPKQEDIEFVEYLEEDEEAANFEEELKQISRGNLVGWRVIYSCDQTTHTSALEEVLGESLDERSESLQKLLLRQGASNSVKVTSIVHAIDWKTQVPLEVEQLVPAIIVKGERWKKIKRQNVRILYQMDPDSKTFIFFIHQKQDWSYNLPAA